MSPPLEYAYGYDDHKDTQLGHRKPYLYLRKCSHLPANCLQNAAMLCRDIGVGLFYLIEHCKQVVSKQELYEQVWEGLASSDATLENCRRVGRDTF